MQPERIADRNFSAFLHNRGAIFGDASGKVLHFPKNLPINHGVAQSLPNICGAPFQIGMHCMRAIHWKSQVQPL
ncbi:hypothetical protein [Paraburkholderia sp. J69-1]|uniref:hypothetical protein n=1 Tax=Paraburkholderia sp. J69-1 TaxID=2805436 RepID=UPI002AB6BCED|nr:hypothetical protein [Paraburkholderia sp. J69-1]